MTTHKLLKVIQLPSKIRIVKQVAFVPQNLSGKDEQVCTAYVRTCIRTHIRTFLSIRLQLPFDALNTNGTWRVSPNNFQTLESTL